MDRNTLKEDLVHISRRCDIAACNVTFPVIPSPLHSSSHRIVPED